MRKVDTLKLKFLVVKRAGRVLVSVKNASNKLVYAFIFKQVSTNFPRVPNKTRLFFKRFQFIVGIVDRLVKNGLIN